MKILIIGAQFLPIPAVEGGAIENLVENFLHYASELNDLEITVYSPFSINNSTAKYDEFKNTEFRYIKKNGLKHNIYRIKLALLRRISKNKTIPTIYSLKVLNNIKKRKEFNIYDLVIIENQIESLITYRKKIKSKMVCHLHNDYLNKNTRNAKQIVQACDEFWGVSKFIVNQIKEIDKSAIGKVLYNGVDLKKYSEQVSKDQIKKMYDKIGFTKQDYIILYTGRIMPQKGVLELIKGFNSIKKEKDNLKLVLVGGKRNKSTEIKKYYEEILDEQQKNKNSIFIYGNANLEELKALYTIANLQVVPSMWEEAFGLIVIEGMCFNHPLIITDSGGMPELVNNSALIIKRKNINEELPNAILKLYNNKEISKSLVESSKKEIKKYDIKKYCENFNKLIFETKNN